VFFAVNVFMMFCPKCGSNQGEGRKFCTSCGTNLLIVSQALSGKLPQSNASPPTSHIFVLERQQRELTKGLYFAIIGGGIMAGRLISFLFSGFRGGFGFWGFVGFVLLAIGIAKIISYRQHAAASAQAAMPPQTYPDLHQSNVQTTPQPVFSASGASDYVAPRTSELDPVEHPKPSVTEAETQNLPRHSPPPEFQR
jgi:predicted lipid-binding transport protein (Tim44 family)